MKIILIFILTYLIASIPNALWIGKMFKGIDLRTKGSGNLGSTNAKRFLGKKLGLMVFILDVSKGFFPVYLTKTYVLSNSDESYKILALLGLVAILAHSYSIYLKFSGGKSVATMLGVYLALNYQIVPIMMIIFIILTVTIKYVSVASMGMGVSAIPLFMLTHSSKYYIILSIIVALLIIYRHESNIKRIINGTESKYREGK